MTIEPEPPTSSDLPDRDSTTRTGRVVNLGGGVMAPYPEPADAAATKVGKANRRKDTKPEIALRSILHRRGLRFRKDHLIRVDDVKVRPDIVFTRAKVAVFVDGCFWHSCPEHRTTPKRNTDYWGPKLQANVDRDRRVNASLTANDWTVIRVWEHEDPTDAATRVAAAVTVNAPSHSENPVATARADSRAR